MVFRHLGHLAERDLSHGRLFLKLETSAHYDLDSCNIKPVPAFCGSHCIAPCFVFSPDGNATLAQWLCHGD